MMSVYMYMYYILFPQIASMRLDDVGLHVCVLYITSADCINARG